VYAGGEHGIDAFAAITGLTIRNCTVSGFGDTGIYMKGVVGIEIHDNKVTDCGYTGIMGIESNQAKVTGNTVQRIQPGATGNGNAYGIVMTQQAGPSSTDWLVDNNLIEDVPTWHGLDTHGGQRITFSNNTIRRCPRPIFITCGGIDHEVCAGDITITGNHFDTAYPANPLGFPNATNVDQAFVTSATGVVFKNNTHDPSFNARDSGKVGSDTYYNYLRDYSSGSTGVVSSGNTIA
jgi:hypothetical protein